MRIYLNNSISYRENNLAATMAAPTNTNKMEELTMTNNTTIATEATTIMENIKAGTTTTTVEKVKGFDIKGFFTKAWTAVKGYDYKGALNTAWASVNNAYDKVDNWLSTTKAGRTTAYVCGATTVMTAVGFLLSPVATVLVGAAAYTGIKAFSKKYTLAQFGKKLAINVALFATIALTAYLVLPYVLMACAYVCHAAVFAMVLPAAAILF